MPRFFGRAFRQAHQIFRGEMPGWCGKHAGTRDVVIGQRDQVEIGENVADQRMLENGKLADDKGNLALRQFFDQLVAMRVLPVEDSKLFPAVAGVVQALEFIRHPGGFVLGRFQFRDADFLAFAFVGLQNLFREFRADFVLADHLSGDA